MLIKVDPILLKHGGNKVAIFGPRMMVGRHYLKKILNNFGLISSLYPKEYKELWDSIAKISVSWEKAAYGYLAKIGNSIWSLRINNFKRGEPKYTLLIDKQVLLSFDALPVNWLIAS